MTTKVIIRNPKNNHQGVEVSVISVDRSTNTERVGEVVDVPDGEERSFYVHTSQDLRITEVPKK